MARYVLKPPALRFVETPFDPEDNRSYAPEVYNAMAPQRLRLQVCSAHARGCAPSVDAD